GDPAGSNNNDLTSNTATVSINVLFVNHPPVAQPDSYSVSENGSLTVTAANGVLANDSDPNDTPPNNLSATLISTVSHGTLFFATDGSFTYTPASLYHGPDSFSYQVKDDGGTAN